MKRVLVTRQKSQSEELVSLLEKAGFSPFSLPLIETTPTNVAIPNDRYDIAILTSPIAVDVFSPYFCNIQIQRLVAVGSKTAKRMEDYGVVPDSIPDEFSAEGLVRLFDTEEVAGLSVLLPGAEKRAGDLVGYFTKRGASVDKVSTYETKAVSYKKGYIDNFLSDNKIDIITLTAPSAAESLISQTENLTGIKLVSIGKTTYQFLHERGYESVYPEIQTIEGMTELISNLYKGA